MAVEAAQVSVGTTATMLSSSEDDRTGGHSVLVKVPTGGSSVFIGGAGVTTAAGYEVPAGEATAFDLHPTDVLYGIVASGTQSVSVLRTGVA